MRRRLAWLWVNLWSADPFLFVLNCVLIATCITLAVMI